MCFSVVLNLFYEVFILRTFCDLKEALEYAVNYNKEYGDIFVLPCNEVSFNYLRQEIRREKGFLRLYNDHMSNVCVIGDNVFVANILLGDYMEAIKG